MKSIKIIVGRVLTLSQCFTDLLTKTYSYDLTLQDVHDLYARAYFSTLLSRTVDEFHHNNNTGGQITKRPTGKHTTTKKRVQISLLSPHCHISGSDFLIPLSYSRKMHRFRNQRTQHTPTENGTISLLHRNSVLVYYSTKGSPSSKSHTPATRQQKSLHKIPIERKR